MKKILFLSFIIVFNFTYANSNEKIYYIDVDSLIKKSNAGKQMLQKINDLNLKNINDLNLKEKKLNNIREKILKKKNVISENEFNKEIKDLEKQILVYRADKDKKVISFNKIKNQEFKNFLSKMSPIIEKYMSSNSINIIMDKKNIFIATSKYDITDKIIDLLNKNIKND